MSMSPAVESLDKALKPKLENPSARMHFRGVGDLLFPGSCCVCGNGTNSAGYVDIGVYFDYEGQVYLCITCLTEAAETGGMLSIEQSEFLKDLCTKVATENEELRTIAKEMSERVEQYESAITSGGFILASDVHPVSLPDSDAPTEPEGSTGDGDGNVNDAPNAQDSGEPVADESVTVSKSKRTRSVTGVNAQPNGNPTAL